MISLDDFEDKANAIHKHCIVIKLLPVAFLMTFNCSLYFLMHWKLLCWLIYAAILWFAAISGTVDTL